MLKHRSSSTRTLADPRQQPFVDIDSFMPARSLTPEELATRCDPAQPSRSKNWSTQPGNNVDDTGSIVGQGAGSGGSRIQHRDDASRGITCS